jgi:hypothetical protein
MIAIIINGKRQQVDVSSIRACMNCWKTSAWPAQIQL